MRAASIATARRCTFSLMTSFSSPNWISSASFASSAFDFSRSASDLPVGERDRLPAVRVRHLDLR